MNIQRVVSKSAALALILSLALPNSALALRAPNAKDSPPLEQALTAGMEESGLVLEKRILRNLEDLRIQTERRLRIPIHAGWHTLNSPKSRMVALANTFLDYPQPLLVKKKVRGLMSRMSRQILEPLILAGPQGLSSDMQDLQELAQILPLADDWLVLAYSPVRNDPASYEHRTRALAVYSRRAAAEAWGRNGPHLRADFVPFDRDDVKTAPILLQGFLPEAQRLLRKLRRLGLKGTEHPRLKRKVEEYAGVLLNGLVVPGLDNSWTPLKDYKRYFQIWEAASQDRLLPAIRSAAAAFPDRFPADPRKMPSFVRFSNQQFTHQEIGTIREFNRSRAGAPLTLWQLTTGTGAAEEYIRYLEGQGLRPLSRRRQMLEQVYGYVLQQAGIAAAPAAGAEQYEWADIDEIPGLRKRMEDADRLDEYETRLIKRTGRYYLVKVTRSLGSHNKRAVWPDVNRASREYAAFVIARALKCNVCDIIIPGAEEKVEIAALLKWQIAPADLYLVELSTNYSLHGDSRVIQKDPKKAFTRRLVAAFLMRYWDLHHNNTGPLKDSHEVRMMFDLDQAFHRSMDSYKAYLLEFAINFDSPGSIDSGAISTVDRAKQSGGIFEVDSLHVLEAIDPNELKEAFKDAKRLDLGKLKEVEGRKFLEKYQNTSHGLEANSDWKAIFGHVEQWQRDLHRDFPRFLHALMETTVYPKAGKYPEKKVIPKIEPGEVPQAAKLYAAAQAALAAASAELRLNREQAGAEQRMDEVAAIAAEAAQGGSVVIVDAAGLEAQPVLQAFLERFRPAPGSPWVVLGDSPAARELRENRSILFADDLGELAGLLMELKRDRGITHVTYLSNGGIFQVRPIVREFRLSFDQRSVSLETFLAGFLPAPLAARLAAGVEAETLIGTEA